MIDLDFVRLVNQLKAIHPCSTESLDRTPYHNTMIKGAKNSWHVKGLAIDLIFDEPSSLLPAAQCAKDLGFGGIEVDYRNLHLHLDMRPDTWHIVYNVNNGKMEELTLEEYLTRSRV